MWAVLVYCALGRIGGSRAAWADRGGSKNLHKKEWVNVTCQSFWKKKCCIVSDYLMGRPQGQGGVTSFFMRF